MLSNSDKLVTFIELTFAIITEEIIYKRALCRTALPHDRKL